MIAEGGQAEEVDPVFTEACAGGSHYLDIFQKVIKAGPGIHTIRALEPNVWGIDAA